MIDRLPELKRSLETTIKHQIFGLVTTSLAWFPSGRKTFNIIVFNDEVQVWSTNGPVKASKKTVNNAISWLNLLKAWGRTSAQEAIEETFQQIMGYKVRESTGIYLITDICPNTSCAKTENTIMKIYGEFNGLDNPLTIEAIDCAHDNRLGQQIITRFLLQAAQI